MLFIYCSLVGLVVCLFCMFVFLVGLATVSCLVLIFIWDFLFLVGRVNCFLFIVI